MKNLKRVKNLLMLKCGRSIWQAGTTKMPAISGALQALRALEACLPRAVQLLLFKQKPPMFTGLFLHSCTFCARTRDLSNRPAPFGIRTGSSSRSTFSGRSVRRRFACSRCPCTGTCSCCRHSPGSRCSPPRSACTCRRTPRDCRFGTSKRENHQRKSLEIEQ